jgi:hypothetical protein
MQAIVVGAMVGPRVICDTVQYEGVLARADNVH